MVNSVASGKSFRVLFSCHHKLQSLSGVGHHTLMSGRAMTADREDFKCEAVCGFASVTQYQIDLLTVIELIVTFVYFFFPREHRPLCW